MTYSVSGLKAVVSSGDFDFMWQNIGILMIFIVVLSLGTIASLTWMHKRQFKNIAENQSVEVEKAPFGAFYCNTGHLFCSSDMNLSKNYRNERKGITTIYRET